MDFYLCPMATDNPQFKQLIAAVEGKTITRVVAAEENGGVVGIDLGDSHTIFIHCAWRLSRYGKVLATWNDTVLEEQDEDDEDETPALDMENLPIKKLQGCLIKNMEVGDFFDLKITLGKEFRLDVFADLHAKETVSDYDENWSVCDIANNLCFVVTENYTLVETKYNTEQQ